MAQTALKRIAQLSIGLGMAAGAVQAVFYNVDGGQAAVMFNRIKGVEKNVTKEGTHLMVPWLQRPYIFDIRIRPRILSTSTGSKDLQTVHVSLRVLFRPKLEQLPQIFQNLGRDYDERVLPSIANEVLKSVIAQFDAVNLITNRDSVSRMVREQLTKRALEFHIILEDVALTHLTFGHEFISAIERKQVAEQEAARAKFLVERMKQEALAVRIKAEGEARSAELIREATKLGSGFVELRRIEAAREIAETLSHSRNVSYLPVSDGGSGGGGILFNMS